MQRQLITHVKLKLEAFIYKTFWAAGWSCELQRCDKQSNQPFYYFKWSYIHASFGNLGSSGHLKWKVCLRALQMHISGFWVQNSCVYTQLCSIFLRLFLDSTAKSGTWIRWWRMDGVPFIAWNCWSQRRDWKLPFVSGSFINWNKTVKEKALNKIWLALRLHTNPLPTLGDGHMLVNSRRRTSASSSSSMNHHWTRSWTQCL